MHRIEEEDGCCCPAAESERFAERVREAAVGPPSGFVGEKTLKSLCNFSQFQILRNHIFVIFSNVKIC